MPDRKQPIHLSNVLSMEGAPTCAAVPHLTQAEELLDWLENNGGTSTEAVLEREGVKVRCVRLDPAQSQQGSKHSCVPGPA